MEAMVKRIKQLKMIFQIMYLHWLGSILITDYIRKLVSTKDCKKRDTFQHFLL